MSPEDGAPEPGGLYGEILTIARDFMGPAAEEYIERRIRIVQRGEDPRTVGPDRLERLAAGIDMTAKIYMAEQRAARFRDRILALKERYPDAG